MTSEIRKWAEVLKEETHLKNDSVWTLLTWDWDYMAFTIVSIPKGLAPMEERKRLNGDQILVRIDKNVAEEISLENLTQFIEEKILRFTKELARAVKLYKKHTGKGIMYSGIDFINEFSTYNEEEDTEEEDTGEDQFLVR